MQTAYTTTQCINRLVQFAAWLTSEFILETRCQDFNTVCTKWQVNTVHCTECYSDKTIQLEARQTYPLSSINYVLIFICDEKTHCDLVKRKLQTQFIKFIKLQPIFKTHLMLVREQNFQQVLSNKSYASCYTPLGNLQVQIYRISMLVASFLQKFSTYYLQSVI